MKYETIIYLILYLLSQRSLTGYNSHKVLLLLFIHGLFNLCDLFKKHPDNINIAKIKNNSFLNTNKPPTYIIILIFLL